MTIILLELGFWLAIIAILYTYIGYPLLLFVLNRFRSRPVQRAPYLPTVTVIITAYNEERDLPAKLENTLSLNYDPERLEVIVASDCSSDRTDEIVNSLASESVILYRQSERLGKTAAQNAAVELARGEVILFSDATTLYEPDVLKKMVPSFADPTVGCVAGKLIYVDSQNSSIGHGARSYWGYETFLKQLESNVCSLIGASGCLYAVRRSAYVPLYNEACSDFIIATKMVEQGLRAVYEPGALCWEQTNQAAKKELKMRVRVITQTYTDLWRHRAMLNPLRSGFYAVQLISHKIFRYLIPVFMIVLLVTSAVLATGSFFFAVVLAAQLFMYGVIGLCWVLSSFGVNSRVVALPTYFFLANLAAIIAFYKFVRGERYARWEPIREGGSHAVESNP